MPVPSKHPWVDVAELGDVTLIHFLQPRIIVEHEIKPIGDLILGLLDEPDCRKVVVNLSGVEVMSSSMVGKLIALQRKMKTLGGQLVLCSVNAALDKVFEIGGLRRVFNLHPDQSSAILALGGPPATP